MRCRDTFTYSNGDGHCHGYRYDSTVTNTYTYTYTNSLSDTDASIKLGEALAISILQDRALTYHEKFTVSFSKIDGTTATISNQ